MTKHFKPSPAFQSLQLADPVVAKVFTDRGFDRYSPEDLALHLILEPCWDRVQAGPVKRIYERPPGFDVVGLRRFFDEAMAKDPAGALSTSVLGEPSGLGPDGRTARYRPVIYSEADIEEPVGFAALAIHLPPLDELDDDELFIVVDCELIYVIPAHRGMGFGITLAQYLSTAISNQLEGIARRWKGGPVKLATLLAGDWESKEGEQVFKTVIEDVQYWTESYGDEIYDQTGVRIALPKEDAGY